MAQTSYSANLSAADFVLSYSFKGPSVVIPGVDQNTLPNLSLSGSTPQKGLNIPQLYYCENVVPTAEGYRSVQYQYFIEPPAVPGEFVKLYTVFDGETNSAVLGITRDRRIYILSFYTGGVWLPLALPGGYTWALNSRFTTATVIGLALFCIEGVGIFQLNIATNTCTKPAVTGITDTLIRGITSSSNYLIAFDAATVYWSSTLNPLDFVPSLISGAGSAKPTGLKGSIRLCREIAGGFIIYTDVNMVSAAYSSSLQFPFVFVVLQGGAGIRSEHAVAYDTNQTEHFAWTSAGLLRIELHNASLLAPQVTDFIGAGISDKTTSFDGYPTTDRNTTDKEVRLAYLASRYLALSFGYLVNNAPSTRLDTPALTQTFLYDTQLNRWGKLNVDHIQLLEVPFAGESQVFF